jgi:hypothetical protein
MYDPSTAPGPNIAAQYDLHIPDAIESTTIRMNQFYYVAVTADPIESILLCGRYSRSE